MTPSVPSDPTSSLVRSYPAEDLRARVPVRITAPIRQNRLQRQDVLPHGAVAHGVGAGGPRGRHAAQAGVRARVDRKEQAGGAQIFVQARRVTPGWTTASMSSAWTSRTRSMRVMSRLTPPLTGITWAFQRGADREWRHRTALRVAQGENIGDLLGRLRKQHRVRHDGRHMGFVAGMMLARRLRGRAAVLRTASSVFQSPFRCPWPSSPLARKGCGVAAAEASRPASRRRRQTRSSAAITVSGVRIGAAAPVRPGAGTPRKAETPARPNRSSMAVISGSYAVQSPLR